MRCEVIKYKLFLLIVFLGSACYSQLSYKFPETFNGYYNFNPKAGKDEVLKSSTDKNKKELEEYVVTYIYNEQLNFDANGVFMDWTEYERYLTKILNTVIPENSTNKKSEIFLFRSSSKNAYTSRFGNIYFDIGLLEVADDEAMLAAIVAHEYAHYLYQHSAKKIGERNQVVTNNHINRNLVVDYLKLDQKFELQADSFALRRMVNGHYNVESILNFHETLRAINQVYYYSTSFGKIVKASNLSPTDFKKEKQKSYRPFASHPSNIRRIESLNQIKSTCKSCTKKYYVDSTLFVKFKKSCHEETKKMLFENSRYDGCLRLCFKDYLMAPKNFRNLYYLIECIRRIMYAHPKLSETGFLTQYIDDDDLFYNTKSILHKPDYIFNSYSEYEKLNNHIFFKSDKKPFNTYQQAFSFFINEALKLNMNEVFLSLGLNFYQNKQKDSCTFYLKKYVSNSNVLYKDFVEDFLTTNAPSIKKGKLFTLYDNTNAFNLVSDLNIRYYENNYYQTIERKVYNKQIKSLLPADTINNKIVILNELLGKRPAELHHYQKLIRNINYLYNDDDVEMCKKIRLSSNNGSEKTDLSDVFKKHLLLLAPEWYSWLKENNYDRVFYVDIAYQYEGFMDSNEKYNTYTGYYLDVNAKRPYIKDAVRLGLNRWQKEVDMCKDLHNFLYE